ncbi:START-like domain-containing protein [Echinicola jeungdonensis]|uniref:START-like domain-containing protein n=1 Tax=Echinicola jeungdonensis TaxID=709343 RepID=A0ABV5J7G2_9BACT|nr:START-like domain-containing protein [Echinicola jeungdonensis]MDN3670901.1 START-like domain-containing protein [Echinicola jeungdonensis]
MVKNKFVADYQMNTSRSVVFPYLSTASGLSEWFADDVTIDDDKVFDFIYEGVDHYAKIVALRSNHSVKFEFFDPKHPEESDRSYVEFRIEENELTQTLFIKVIEYSDTFDDDAQETIWEGLINNLKEIIGG